MQKWPPIISALRKCASLITSSSSLGFIRNGGWEILLGITMSATGWANRPKVDDQQCFLLKNHQQMLVINVAHQ